MTSSINNSSSTSQAQLLQLLQQIAAQQKAAADQTAQDQASQDNSTSPSVTAAAGLTGGTPGFSGDIFAVLVQSQSVSAPDATTQAGQSGTQQNTFGQDFQKLAEALQSGNLSAAQQAFTTLSQDISTQTQSVQASSQASNGNSPFATALSQIGSDLQSGNLTGAQQTLSSLEQAGPQAHHHHHGGGGKGGGGDLLSALDGSSSTDSSSSSSTPGETTVTNADGSVTTTTTNPDGSVTTITLPASETASGSNPNAQALEGILASLQQIQV